MIILSIYLFGVLVMFVIMFLMELSEHKSICANFLVRDLTKCIMCSLFSWAGVLGIVLMFLVVLIFQVKDTLVHKIGNKTLINFQSKKK